MSTFVPVFMSFPIINTFARMWGQQSPVLWLSIAILLAMLAFMDMAYGQLSLA